MSWFGSGWSWGSSWVMNAEVTAENRPACGPSQYTCIWSAHTTHEYQRCVQVFIIFLHKFPIVFFRFLAVVLVESSAKVFLV